MKHFFRGSVNSSLPHGRGSVNNRLEVREVDQVHVIVRVEVEALAAGSQPAAGSGEDEAANQVFLRFARRLVGLARGHLDTRLAAKVDPEDVVQSAYKSFFVRHRRGELEVGSWDGLWGLLTLITLRKCADRAAYFKAEKRDYNREVGPAPTDSTPAAWQQAVDRDPSPEEAAMLAETVTALFQSLEDPDDVIQPGITHDPFERPGPQRSLADHFVTIAPGSERGLGIVQVDASQVFDS